MQYLQFYQTCKLVATFLRPPNIFEIIQNGSGRSKIILTRHFPKKETLTQWDGTPIKAEAWRRMASFMKVPPELALPYLTMMMMIMMIIFFNKKGVKVIFPEHSGRVLKPLRRKNHSQYSFHNS